jgi:hypothetical protein
MAVLVPEAVVVVLVLVRGCQEAVQFAAWPLEVLAASALWHTADR